MNLSNYILTDLDDTESKLNAGASLGGFMKWDITDNFALQPELLFHYKNADMESNDFDGNYEYWGVEIPVYALGQWSLGNGRLYAGAGPYLGLGFSNRSYPGDRDLYEEFDDESAMRRWDFGAGVQVGYEFACRVQVNAGYKIGLLDVMDAGRDDASMNTSTLSVGIGYRF
jgi:opacity protein-like surface antigen